jgi:peroxiredoxin
MGALTPLFRRQPVPDLELPLVGGGTWRLAGQTPKHFTMIVFYRGRHCPQCSFYLADLNGKADAFEARGVTILTASSDGEDRAADARATWKLDNLAVAYGLGLDKAREWGLYISTGRGKTSSGIEEPPLFSEPGLFLVRPDRTLYFAAVQTMPFARPHFADILKALDFVIEKDYPARGEVVDHRAGARAAE